MLLCLAGGHIINYMTSSFDVHVILQIRSAELLGLGLANHSWSDRIRGFIIKRALRGLLIQKFAAGEDYQTNAKAHNIKPHFQRPTLHLFLLRTQHFWT